MTLLNYAYPILVSILSIGMLFIPALLIVGLIPKRLPALRHAVLAATFVALLGWILISPLVESLGSSSAAPSTSAVAQVTRPRPAAPAAQPAGSHVLNLTLPDSFRPNWEFTSVFFGFGRFACLLWLGLSYGITLLLLVRSKPSQRRSSYRVSRYARVPVTLWAFRHFIVMPVDADEWTDDRLDRVIAHEQAHIRRWDWFWQAGANIINAFTVLNPVSWICLRKLRTLAEEVADQQVLLQNENAAAYATDLLEIAKSARRSGNCAVLAIATRSSLRARVQAILNGSRPRRASRLGLACSACLAVLSLGACAVLALPAVGQALSVSSGGRNPAQLLTPPEGYPGMNTSYYADIRHGLTTPGRTGNGWTARYSNGVDVKLLGIFFGTSGGAEFRSPDGKVIVAPTKASKFVTGHAGRLDLLFSVPADRVDKSSDIGIGSSSHIDFKRQPSSLTFAGGFAAAAPDGKNTYVHGFLELTNPHSGESVDEAGKLIGHGPLATEVSVSLAYEDKNNEVKAIPLESLLAGKNYALNDGIASRAHRTNAEKQCFSKIGLAHDAFGVRLEVPRESMTSYQVVLADSEDGQGAVDNHQGCGGQEDATAGYRALQEWFLNDSASKKFAIIKGSRSYAVDFLSISLLKSGQP